jgi:Uma2 family endonuclease
VSVSHVEASLIAELPVRPLRRVEFERLAGDGFFADERVELLCGVVVEMTPIDPAHDEAVSRLGEMLVRQLAGRARIRIQASYAASEITEPVPDAAVVPVGAYWTQHPDTAELIVEVARTSLRRDRGLKRRLYATGGVAEYWIVNLVEACVEVFRDPLDGEWTSSALYRRGDVLHLLRFPDVMIQVSELLPPV